MRSLLLASIAVLTAAAALLAFACVPNPSIDGSRVRPIGSPDAPASCDLLCERIAKLCGFPPYDCVATCDAEYDLVHKTCLGEAVSCQQALEVCANEEVDAAADGADDAPAELDASEDAIADAGGIGDAGDGG